MWREEGCEERRFRMEFRVVRNAGGRSFEELRSWVDKAGEV
jgi:hypothetical protein